MASTDRFRLAVAQLCSTDDVQANLATCEALVTDAAEGGARVVVLPECFAYLSRTEEQKLAIAEVIDPTAPGPILTAVQQWAHRHGVWVIGGGMAERAPGDPRPTKVYNTAIAVAPNGQLVGRYRKIHLFDVDIPNRARIVESDSTFAGTEPHLLETPVAAIGLSICYDLRFPELYRELALRGAHVLAVPSAFTAHTGAAHWHVLLRARAIENQCYVAAAAQSGRHNENRHSYGHSLIVDPWGRVLAECEGERGGVAIANIDLTLITRIRSEMPCQQHRRL